MAYTEAQRDALKKALASGVLRVSYDGTTTEYRAVDELRTALSTVERELAADAGKTALRQVRVYATKGL